MKKIIIITTTTALLFIFFHAAIEAGLPSSPGLDPQESNIIRFEKFTRVKETPPPVVLIGSSISAALGDIGLPHVTNLSFSGGSALTGLDYLDHFVQLPKIFLVELHESLTLGVDEAFIKDQLSPTKEFLFDLSPVFMTQYRPLSILTFLTKTFFENFLKKKPPTIDPRIKKQRFDEILREETNANLEHSMRLWSAALTKLLTYSRNLESRGARVYYYLPPRDSKLPQTKYYRNWAGLFINSVTKNRQIAFSQDFPWETTDGVHLDHVSLDEVARNLKNFLASKNALQ